MTCPNCTKMIPDGSRFCCHCGTNLQTKSNKQHAHFGPLGLFEDPKCPVCGEVHLVRVIGQIDY